MRVSVVCACVVLAAALGACDNSMKLLKPVDDARAAVKQHFGHDWNITLPTVGKSDAGEVICGYTEAPHAPTPGASPPLSDERLFIYADHRLILPNEMGRKAFSDRIDKDCPALPRVKTIAPGRFTGLSQ